MSSTDPLALRHGVFISQIWSIIAEARTIARADPTKGECVTQLRRLRFLRHKVLALHRTETHRGDTLMIEEWFQPVEDTLARAEAYFAQQLHMHSVAAAISYSHAGTPTAALA